VAGPLLLVTALLLVVSYGFVGDGWFVSLVACCFLVASLLLPCCFLVASLLLPCCFLVTSLLLPCCFLVASLLLPCCFLVTSLLLPCYFLVASLLLPCCCLVAALLLPCCCLVAALLLSCCFLLPCCLVALLLLGYGFVGYMVGSFGFACCLFLVAALLLPCCWLVAGLLLVGFGIAGYGWFVLFCFLLLSPSLISLSSSLHPICSSGKKLIPTSHRYFFSWRQLTFLSCDNIKGYVALGSRLPFFLAHAYRAFGLVLIIIFRPFFSPKKDKIKIPTHAKCLIVAGILILSFFAEKDGPGCISHVESCNSINIIQSTTLTVEGPIRLNRHI
jgi:hypothetical protein